MIRIIFVLLSVASVLAFVPHSLKLKIRGNYVSMKAETDIKSFPVPTPGKVRFSPLLSLLEPIFYHYTSTRYTLLQIHAFYLANYSSKHGIQQVMDFLSGKSAIEASKTAEPALYRSNIGKKETRKGKAPKLSAAGEAAYAAFEARYSAKARYMVLN